MNQRREELVRRLPLAPAGFDGAVSIPEVLRRRVEQGQHGEVDFEVAIAAGGIDQRRDPAFHNKDVAAPQVAMEEGGTRRGRKQIAEARRDPLDPLPPRAVEHRGGGDKALLPPEAKPVRALAIVEPDASDLVIDRPAEAVALL